MRLSLFSVILLSGEQNKRIIFDLIVEKNGGKEQNGLRKYSVCAAAQAAKVNNYKHKPRVADKSAVSQAVLATGSHFFSHWN